MAKGQLAAGKSRRVNGAGAPFIKEAAFAPAIILAALLSRFWESKWKNFS